MVIKPKTVNHVLIQKNRYNENNKNLSNEMAITVQKIVRSWFPKLLCSYKPN